MIDGLDGKTTSALKQLKLTDLRDNEVLVQVAYSTVNYKDGHRTGGAAGGVGSIVIALLSKLG